MRSNFKKFKFQISQVHTGTSWYIPGPVRTGTDISHRDAHTFHFDDALAAFLRRRVSTAHLESYTPGTCQYVPVRTDLYRPVL